MPLARFNGKLLRVDGLLSTDCCCEVDPVCVYAMYQHPAWTVDAVPLPRPPCGSIGYFGCDYIAGTQYIAKPTAFAGRRVSVRVAGWMDDSIAIDGAVVGTCRPGGDIEHTFELSAAQQGFVLGAVDNFGVCCDGSVSICFATINPLP